MESGMSNHKIVRGLYPVKKEVLMHAGPALLCGTINLTRHIK